MYACARGQWSHTGESNCGRSFSRRGEYIHLLFGENIRTVSWGYNIGKSMSCSTQTHRLDHYIRCLLKRSFFMSVTYSQSRSLFPTLPGGILGVGAGGAPPPPPPPREEMTCGFLIPDWYSVNTHKKLCGLLVLKQSKRQLHPLLKKILDPPLL